MEFDPSKRSFFTRSGKRVSEIVVKEIEQRVDVAQSLPRPPFALTELEFLLKCSRCNACVESCPHDVLINLPESTGLKFKDTPVMNLESNACHLCTDWPCVIACNTLAISNLDNLIHHKVENKYYPKFTTVKIDTERCLPFLGPECGACEGSCPLENTLTFKLEKPYINPEQCTGCSLCYHSCILDPSAIVLSHLND